MENRNLESFVLEFQDGKYAVIASGLRWFLRVISVSEMPLLLGQKQGMDGAFTRPSMKLFALMENIRKARE